METRRGRMYYNSNNLHFDKKILQECQEIVNQIITKPVFISSAKKGDLLVTVYNDRNWSKAHKERLEKLKPLLIKNVVSMKVYSHFYDDFIPPITCNMNILYSWLRANYPVSLQKINDLLSPVLNNFLFRYTVIYCAVLLNDKLYNLSLDLFFKMNIDGFLDRSCSMINRKPYGAGNRINIIFNQIRCDIAKKMKDYADGSDYEIACLHEYDPYRAEREWRRHNCSLDYREFCPTDWEHFSPEKINCDNINNNNNSSFVEMPDDSDIPF